MEVDLNRKVEYLLNSKLVERISTKKLKINGKGRIYNPTKPSKILTKVVSSLYNKRLPQEPKPGRRIGNVKEAPANSANVLLKYDDDRVDQSKFTDFIKHFEDSQKKKENAHVVELKFRVEIIRQSLGDDEKFQSLRSVTSTIGFARSEGVIGEIEIKEEFIKTQTAYGGDVGLKLYIKTEIMYLVHRYEDSAVYIKTITLTNIYVPRRNQAIPVNFRHKNAWNTL